MAFRLQLALAKKHHLPLFLHSRAAHADFVAILREEGFGEDGGRAVGGRGGVVHSFTGTTEEIVELVGPSRYPFHARAKADDEWIDGDGVPLQFEWMRAQDAREPGRGGDGPLGSTDARNRCAMVQHERLPFLQRPHPILTP